MHVNVARSRGAGDVRNRVRKGRKPLLFLCGPTMAIQGWCKYESQYSPPFHIARHINLVKSQ